jgi:hypothetical protein
MSSDGESEARDAGRAMSSAHVHDEDLPPSSDDDDGPGPENVRWPHLRSKLADLPTGDDDGGPWPD